MMTHLLVAVRQICTTDTLRPVIQTHTLSLVETAGIVITISYEQWQQWSVSKHLYSWWRHQIETFSVLLAIRAENSPVAGEFPAQRPVTRSFDVFFICAWINRWVNSREAGDLRRHRAHYDVIVMSSIWTGNNLHVCIYSLKGVLLPDAWVEPR